MGAAPRSSRPEAGSAARSLTRLHRAGWVAACAAFLLAWSIGCAVHTAVALRRAEHRVYLQAQAVVRSLRQAPEQGASEAQLRERWLPRRLEEVGFEPDDARWLSPREAEAWQARHPRTPGGPHGFEQVARTFGPRGVGYELLLLLPDASILEELPPPPARRGAEGRPDLLGAVGFPPPQPMFAPPGPAAAARFEALLAHSRPVLLKGSWNTALLPLAGLYGGLLLAGLAALLSLRYALDTTRRGLEQALAVAHAKANFTAMVSHELKTPVTAFRMYAEMLRDGLVADPAKQQAFYATMASEAVRLQRLIENLLELGRLQGGDAGLRLSPEPPLRVIAEAVSQLPADGRDRIRIVPNPEAPRLQVELPIAARALANVLENALKYAPDGGITVEIVPAADARAWGLRVTDAGPGIPAGQSERIFEPYVRVGDEDTRQAPGTGLGLALVRGYMAGHGGRVTLESPPGGGSRFTLYFQPASSENAA